MQDLNTDIPLKFTYMTKMIFIRVFILRDTISFWQSNVGFHKFFMIYIAPILGIIFLFNF